MHLTSLCACTSQVSIEEARKYLGRENAAQVAILPEKAPEKQGPPGP